MLQNVAYLIVEIGLTSAKLIFQSCRKFNFKFKFINYVSWSLANCHFFLNVELWTLIKSYIENVLKDNPPVLLT